MNHIDLQNRHAVVTGGAQGFGLAIVDRMLASGAKVSMWDIDSLELETATTDRNRTIGVQCDVTDPDAIQAASGSVTSH